MATSIFASEFIAFFNQLEIAVTHGDQCISLVVREDNGETYVYTQSDQLYPANLKSYDGKVACTIRTCASIRHTTSGYVLVASEGPSLLTWLIRQRFCAQTSILEKQF